MTHWNKYLQAKTYEQKGYCGIHFDILYCPQQDKFFFLFMLYVFSLFFWCLVFFLYMIFFGVFGSWFVSFWVLFYFIFLVWEYFHIVLLVCFIVCLFVFLRKNLNWVCKENMRIWKDLEEGKNMIKWLLNLKMFIIFILLF